VLVPKATSTMAGLAAVPADTAGMAGTRTNSHNQDLSNRRIIFSSCLRKRLSRPAAAQVKKNP
jgi:hypothetical protein